MISVSACKFVLRLIFYSLDYVAKVSNGRQSQVADGHLGWALFGHLGLGSDVHPGLKWPTDLKV